MITTDYIVIADSFVVIVHILPNVPNFIPLIIHVGVPPLFLILQVSNCHH